MRSSIILILAIVASVGSFTCSTSPASPTTKTKGADDHTGNTSSSTLKRLQTIAGELKQVARRRHFNTRYCFLIDMKIASGKRRFFVYDLAGDSVLTAGLVTHGYGSNLQASASFSNVVGSNCSSLGNYKIGSSYTGRFGLAFKLYGLDSSNSNAFKRFVVLHAHPCVPEQEVAPQSICMSQGCPTVAPSFLLELGKYLGQAEAPVLLRIFH